VWKNGNFSENAESELLLIENADSGSEG
jgi:hypothetical protein